MGAALLLTSDAGQFSVEQIPEYLRGVPGLAEADDDPCKDICLSQACPAVAG